MESNLNKIGEVSYWDLILQRERSLKRRSQLLGSNLNKIGEVSYWDLI